MLFKNTAAFVIVITSFIGASAQTVDVSEKRLALLPSCLDVENQLVTSLSRRVLGTDAKSIANAQVSVEDGALKVVFTARSDRNGRYAIRGLKPGDYRVVLSASGYVEYQYALVVPEKTHTAESVVRLRPNAECHDNGLGYETAEPMSYVDYCPAVERMKPNLRLSRAVQLQGKIVDQSGASIDNSRIELRRYLPDNQRVSIKSATTGPDGKFDFGAVEEGEYRLIFLSMAFRQPEEMSCRAEGKCFLDITLKVNPTDLPGSECPVR
jgi:5-hydroxyisourate hydrolase-like protein (transthyretin family)